jgi:hypothetical protein
VPPAGSLAVIAAHHPPEGGVPLTGLQAFAGLGAIRLKWSSAWLTPVSASCTADFVLWSRTVPLWASMAETTPTLTMAKAAISISIVVGSANPRSPRSRVAMSRILVATAGLMPSIASRFGV